MTIMRLGDFITANMDSILLEWEAFASTIVPPALTMDSQALRNHTKQMLQEIVVDLGNAQSAEAQVLKSYGTGRLLLQESSAEAHAAARLFSGFTVEQLISEYRALRASVLKLWANSSMAGVRTDPMDVLRFNEAIDQAVAESVARYAEMVSKSQHMFLAILGHDLRNPLATTLMASRFIMEGEKVDTRISTAATRIHNAGQRMNKLVSDLIDYTRTNLGSSLPVIAKEVNLEDLCRDAVAEQELAHPNYTFELIVQGNCNGQWDDNRIAQVLSNLLGNAVQYGGTDTPVVLRLHSDANEVVLCVENMGKLIPAKKINTVFEPLVRLASDDESGASTTSLGIGLYITREIVRAHGGSIKVTSTEAKGTVFAVTLPRESTGRLVPHWTKPPPAVRA